MKPIHLLSLLLGLALAPAQVYSQTSTELVTPPGMKLGQFGVGFASSWPAYGISGAYRLNETMTAEAVLGLVGNLTTISGRGRYHFKPAEKFEFYGFGTVGMYRYDDGFFDESTFGIGGGVGIETSLPALFEDEELPGLVFGWDIGLTFASFDEYGGFSALVWGGSIHYRFGDRAAGR